MIFQVSGIIQGRILPGAQFLSSLPGMKPCSMVTAGFEIGFGPFEDSNANLII